MIKQSWSLVHDLDQFDLGESGARVAEWRDREALYLEKGLPVLLHDAPNYENFRIQVEIACPEAQGHAGIVFRASDAQNYELIYVSPPNDNNANLGEIQYDPVMKGSNTWQIYHGPVYQAPAPLVSGEWNKLTIEVQSSRVKIYVGESVFINGCPQLVISNLQLTLSNTQHDHFSGTIGVWGYLPCYFRNLTIIEIEPTVAVGKESTPIHKETFISEWLVSNPYLKDEQLLPESNWTNVKVDENGTLNLNRLYTCVKGTSVQAKSNLEMLEAKEAELTFGFSDSLRLWVNDEEVYNGKWKWSPPGGDGRIRTDYASVSIQWKTGINSIRAEVSSLEDFGWGISMKIM